MSNYYYTHEMNLEYFAHENDMSLTEDDIGNLFIYFSKEDKTYEEVVKFLSNCPYNFEIQEFKTHYRVC